MYFNNKKLTILIIQLFLQKVQEILQEETMTIIAYEQTTNNYLLLTDDDKEFSIDEELVKEFLDIDEDDVNLLQELENKLPIRRNFKLCGNNIVGLGSNP